MNSLEKTIIEMRKMAEFLVPNTWPLVDFKDEQDVLILKQRVIRIDGYEVVVCLSRADYGEYILDSLQIQSYQSPFLPFYLVCKIGKMFLGRNILSYIDFFRGDKKVYCWAINHFEGRTLPPYEGSIDAEFEGYKYRILAPGTVDLF